MEQFSFHYFSVQWQNHKKHWKLLFSLENLNFSVRSKINWIFRGFSDEKLHTIIFQLREKSSREFSQRFYKIWHKRVKFSHIPVYISLGENFLWKCFSFSHVEFTLAQINFRSWKSNENEPGKFTCKTQNNKLWAEIIRLWFSSRIKLSFYWFFLFFSQFCLHLHHNKAKIFSFLSKQNRKRTSSSKVQSSLPKTFPSAFVFLNSFVSKVFFRHIKSFRLFFSTESRS